jgi:hypothetical protein
LAASNLAEDAGAEGMRALEGAIRSSMLGIGASVLESFLGTDTGRVGQHVDCGSGHTASYVNDRPKVIESVMGPFETMRAYYHCPQCHSGVVPKDVALGVEHTTLSPGLRAMADLTATAVPFAKAEGLLAELAGVTLGAKRIERCAEADGRVLMAIAEREAAAVADGVLVAIGPPQAPEKLYVVLTAPVSRWCLQSWPVGPARPLTVGRTPVRPSSGSSSPRAGSTTKASPCATRAPRATSPPWSQSSTSVCS